MLKHIFPLRYTQKQMNDSLQSVASTLRAARTARALTQKELGRRVGLPQSHISKIENGAVDLQLSSLVELARALELEVTLVPRKALPAVEGAVRAHGTSVETSRAQNLLTEQVELAKRIKTSFPDLSEIESFQNAIRDVPRIQFDAARLKALDEALQPAKRLKALIDAQGGVAKLARQIEEATSALTRFRNLQVHSPLIGSAPQRPAHRLEEDDG